MALPAPTAISATSRYFLPETRRFTWVPTIANKNAPTSAELTAGTDLSGDIETITGFDVTSADVQVPDLGTRYVSTIPGQITTSASSVTMYASSTSQDVRQLLTRDLNGFVVIYPEGINTGNTCDVYPVRISSVSKAEDVTKAGEIVITFSVTSQPVLDLAIPTA